MPNEGEDLNIITKTAQKDKAAVVKVFTSITGTAIYPDYSWEVNNPEADMYGYWEDEGASNGMLFSPDNTFLDIYSDETYSGSWVADETFIAFAYSDGTEQIYAYEQSGSSLSMYNADTDATYSYNFVDFGTSENYLAYMQSLEPVANVGMAADTLERDLFSGASGTGFIVSSDGYIVTNAHVVGTGDDLESQLLSSFVYDIFSEYSAETAGRYNIPEDYRDAANADGALKMLDYLQNYGSLTSVQKDVYVFSGIAQPGEDLQADATRALIKKEGEVFDKVTGEWTWGRDVAIIKINENNLPTVTLGDSDRLQTGEQVFIIGYPGLGSVEGFFAADSTLEPTVSAGVLSAFRTLKSGIESIQTDAAINHGNSGGPVYNSKGEVIGLATFGAGPETGIEAIKFAMPINLAKEFLNELNVDTNTPSLVDQKFEEALNAFWSRDCESAMGLMQEVLNIYPGHPYAQEYITESYRAQSAGECAVKATTTTVSQTTTTVSQTTTTTVRERDNGGVSPTVYLLGLLIIVGGIVGIVYVITKNKK